MAAHFESHLVFGEVTDLAWQVDIAHTQVSFSIRHLGVSFIKGTLAVADAELNLDEANPANSSLKGRMDMSTFSTHDPNRDGHLKSADFFDVENNPYIEFATKRVADKGKGKFDVTGDLTIKGTTGEVALEGEYAGPVLDPISGKRKVGFTMRGEIDKTAFGVTWNVPMEGGTFMLADKVTLDINAQAIEA
jgi:polyisoprenoid-binding protein YceI